MNMTDVPGEALNEAELDLYSPHVKSYPNYPGIKTPYIPLDCLLGSLLLLCALIGIPGNILGIFFFASVTRENKIAKLYIIICSIDTITSFTPLPVAIAMFRGRKPGLFNEHTFCILWAVVYTTLQKMSIFLVLVLSISRTVAIVRPLNKIRTKIVMISVAGYLVIVFLIPLIAHVIQALGGEDFKYSWDGAYCYYNYRTWMGHVTNIVQVGLPPIITFITLIVSVINLSNGDKMSTRRTSVETIQKIRYQASITIAMFTSLFLVCNIPLFIKLMYYLATKFLGVEYPGVYLGSRFMFWYSWHIANIDTVVLNAVLNPVLYYCRMRDFRTWCSKVIRGKLLAQREYNAFQMTELSQKIVFDGNTDATQCISFSQLQRLITRH